jgi:hypothetical protein
VYSRSAASIQANARREGFMPSARSWGVVSLVAFDAVGRVEREKKKGFGRRKNGLGELYDRLPCHLDGYRELRRIWSRTLECL